MGNLDGLVTVLIVIGVIIGAVAMLVGMYAIPFLWDVLKPWFHAMTA